MKNIYIAVMLLGIGMCPEKGKAQEQFRDSTLNRTVTVENEYNPQVMDAFKVNVLPQIEEPEVTPKHIDYEQSVYPFTLWRPEPMKSVMVESNERQDKAYRGYLRTVYGTRNNLDAKFSYLWDLTRCDQLSVMASCYGMNGNVFHWEGGEVPDWKARFYRSDASLGYRHSFNKVTLSLGGNFASQVFSYMPGVMDGKEVSGRQHYTLGEGFLGLSSVNNALPVHFSFQTGFRSFNRKYGVPALNKGAESIIHTLGNVFGEISEEHHVGIAFSMDNLLYDNQLKDYTLIRLNPYYTLENEVLRLRLGAHVDWQTANGSGIKVAPDVDLNYTFAESYVLYVQLHGSTRLNDYRMLNELSPFGMEGLQMKSTYTPLDAQAGLKASPLPGLGFRLYGGYRIAKDEVFLSAPFSDSGETPYYVKLNQKKAKVGYGGAEIAYGFKDYFDFSVSGMYHSWSMDAMWKPLLWLKPEWSIDCAVRAKVVSDLTVSARYHNESRVKVGNLPKAEAVNNLTLGAGYEFCNRINVFVNVHNLLNKEYLMENAYPVQGFYVMAGASIRF